ncbi:MAG: cation:proton antiporter [Actinomycetota bacterium]
MDPLGPGALVATAAGTVFSLGVLARALASRWPLSEALLALALGVAAGPFGLGLFTPSALGLSPSALEQAARYTLGVARVSAAFDLTADVVRQWRSIGLLLAAGMVGMWLTTTMAAWLLLPFGPGDALLVGAILAPTDPVLAGGILGGPLAERNVPVRLRTLLLAESAANDGLALPFVLFGLGLASSSPWPATVRDLVVRGFLWEVGVGAAVAIGLGWLAGRAVATAQRRLDADAAALAAASVSVGICALTLAHLVHVDGILAAFLAALVFVRTSGHAGDQAWRGFARGTKRFLELPFFVLLGIALPVDRWAGIGLPLLAFAMVALGGRRLPTIWAISSLIPEFERPALVWFSGWFGPMGTSAAFYAAFAPNTTSSPMSSLAGPPAPQPERQDHGDDHGDKDQERAPRDAWMTGGRCRHLLPRHQRTFLLPLPGTVRLLSRHSTAGCRLLITLFGHCRLRARRQPGLRAAYPSAEPGDPHTTREKTSPTIARSPHGSTSQRPDRPAVAYP